MKIATLAQAFGPPRAAVSVRGRWRAALVLALCLVAQAGGADVVVTKEHEIKAAFVYNFLKFVEWPEDRFGKTNSPVIIGVVGTSPITAALEITVKDRAINGREIHVKTVETLEGAKASHLLYFPAATDHRADEFLSSVPAGVLTVGESGGFGNRNGIINFVLEGDKVRFEINVDAAEQAALKISAQLQKLAKTVRRRTVPAKA
jgi:hypothetical protein